MTTDTTPLVLPDPKDPLFRPRLRGWLHLYAFAVAIVCGAVLCAVAATRPGWAPLLGVGVYSVTICGLFGVSALYHRRVWGPRGYAAMKRLDHSMIFVFIAGTYTPLCLLLLAPARGELLLSIVWTGAVCGVALKLVWPGGPKWFSVPLYIGLGWVAVVALPEFLHRGGVATMVLLGAGGLLYSVGAVFYASRWPNPWPRTFGHHEFFHACTLAAAVCHHIAIYFALFV